MHEQSFRELGVSSPVVETLASRGIKEGLSYDNTGAENPVERSYPAF